MERLRSLIAPSRIFMVAQWAIRKKSNATCAYLRPSATAFTFCTQGNAHFRNGDTRLVSLLEKLEMANIFLESNALRGQNQRCVCPQCGGGTIKVKNLSVFIDEKGTYALWNCFKATCAWSGRTQTTHLPVHSSQLLDTPDPERGASNSNLSMGRNSWKLICSSKCGGGPVEEKSLPALLVKKYNSRACAFVPDLKKSASISNASMGRNSWKLIGSSEVSMGRN